MITVIMTGYNRPYIAHKQLEAIKNQSEPPADIFFWRNMSSEAPTCFNLPIGLDEGVKGVYSNHNWKFHGRFAFALLAQTEYIALFDDDTIPGKDWFKNCLQTMEHTPGILGTTGIKLISNRYDPHVKVGFNAHQSGNQPNYLTQEVDLVGHAWFFKREWLKHMWAEYPLSWENGEDIQFSYLCQKYGDIKTYVPPHPLNKEEMWGSIEPEHGQDKVASWRKTNHMPLRNMIVKECVDNGWKPICLR